MLHENKAPLPDHLLVEVQHVHPRLVELVSRGDQNGMFLHDGDRLNLGIDREVAGGRSDLYVNQDGETIVNIDTVFDLATMRTIVLTHLLEFGTYIFSHMPVTSFGIITGMIALFKEPYIKIESYKRLS